MQLNIDSGLSNRLGRQLGLACSARWPRLPQPLIQASRYRRRAQGAFADAGPG